MKAQTQRYRLHNWQARVKGLFFLKVELALLTYSSLDLLLRVLITSAILSYRINPFPAVKVKIFVVVHFMFLCSSAKQKLHAMQLYKENASVSNHSMLSTPGANRGKQII